MTGYIKKFKKKNTTKATATTSVRVKDLKRVKL